jgi:glycosyltransferase involved in cell wall biosynthesis
LGNRSVTVTVLVTGQGTVIPAENERVAVRTVAFPSSPRSLAALTDEVLSLRPTVVCVQFEANAFGLDPAPHLVPLALRLAGVPVMVFYHELWPPKRFAKLAKVALLNAPHSVGVSTDWHAAGVRRFRRVGPPPVLIPVASNIVRRTGEPLDRVRYGLPVGRIVLTFFGFVGPQHCFAELIDAVARIRDTGIDVCLSVIGAVDFLKNGYHQYLRGMVEELVLVDRVIWHGRVAEDDAVARLISATDIAVIPYADGVGENNGAFAALARFGLPIVTTRGDRSARLEERGTALFAEATGAGLSESIMQLLEQAELRAEVAAAALRWASEHDWDAAATAYLSEFERIAR